MSKDLKEIVGYCPFGYDAL